MASITTPSSGEEWPLVGRDRVLAEAAAALRAGRGVAVVGPVGVGRTTLARSIVGDRPATWLRPVAELSHVPLGSLALLLGDSGSSGGLSELSLTPVAEALAGTVAGGVLVVDDAHHLDPASAGLIHQLVTVRGQPVVLTLADGEPAPEALTRLWLDGLVVRVDLGPLQLGDIGALLAAVLGGPVDPALVDDVHVRSLGAPLLVRELVTAGLDQGVIARAGGGGRVWRATGPLPAPSRLTDLVRSRLASLPADLRAVVDLVAVVERLPLAVLEAAAPSDAIAALEQQGLVVVDDEPSAALVSPVLAHVARDLQPVSARRATLRRLADLLAPRARSAGDHVRVVRWRLDGGADLPIDELLEGTRSALQMGDVDLALRVSRVAFEQAPTLPIGVLRAQVLLRAERHDEAVEVLDVVASLAETEDEIVALTQTRAQVLAYGQGRGGDAAAEVAAARDRAGGGLAHVEGALLLYEGRPAEAAELVRGHVDEATGDRRVYGGMVSAVAEMLLGHLHEALAIADRIDAAILHPGATDMVRADPAGDRHMVEVVRLLCRVELGELAAVTEVGGRRWDEWSADEHGAAWSHWLAWVLGRGALVRGAAPEAARWFRRSEVTVAGSLPALLGGWVKGSRAYAELLTGDIESAAELVEPEPAVPAAPEPGDDGADRARAWLLAAKGQLDEAARVLKARADELAARGVHMFESALRHDVVRLGVTSAARGAADRLAVLADHVDGPLAAARAAHGAAWAAGDARALGIAAERFAGLGANLFAAEAAAQGASIAGRRDQRQATALASLARGFRERCDVALTPAMVALDVAPGLTPRERQIAELAAAGAASKEIAAELGLSRRTVDNTLQRVFVKLGVTRRADLARRL